MLVLTLSSSTLAAKEKVVCKTDLHVPYIAELSGVGNGRSLQVTFSKRPTPAVATKIVALCMQSVIDRDKNHELLGSAWIGESHFALAPKKDDLVYFPNEGRIRPFGIDEVIQRFNNTKP